MGGVGGLGMSPATAAECDVRRAAAACAATTTYDHVTV